ncbi:MAG: hypothetical protein BK997_02990 [Candidatus Micrarchaeum sp. ARMAN-1]|nr:MAG: hypothetical protein BK997_02990 [Candidatus Micrarchaeum sp. ARMAN-1]
MEEFEAYIEMLSGSSQKYVYNEKLGKLVVHRKPALPLPEGFNYGFINGTLSADGDQLDVFVMSSKSLALGSTVKVRPIGLLYVKDEMGRDNKIIAVDSLDKSTKGISELSMLGKEKLSSLSYMLEHNKDGLEGRWTKVDSAGDSKAAVSEILMSIKNYERSRNRNKA